MNLSLKSLLKADSFKCWRVTLAFVAGMAAHYALGENNFITNAAEQMIHLETGMDIDLD